MGKAAIHIIHSKLQIPSNVFLVYITFVTTVLILLLLEPSEWLQLITEAFLSQHVYKLFSLFCTIVLNLQFSVNVSGTFCILIQKMY
jgi:ABC-type multidrug transport system permease subunit